MCFPVAKTYYLEYASTQATRARGLSHLRVGSTRQASSSTSSCLLLSPRLWVQGTAGSSSAGPPRTDAGGAGVGSTARSTARHTAAAEARLRGRLPGARVRRLDRARRGGTGA